MSKCMFMKNAIYTQKKGCCYMNEKDNNSLNYIKSKLPNCYICNLDGKVIS